MNKDKVISLITKLKKLSENNSNIEEASLAASRMQELIERHNISEAELDVEEVEEFSEDLFYKEKGKNITRWKLTLAGELAKLNNCKIVFTKGYKDKSLNLTIPAKIHIYGKPSKVSLVHYLFMYLVREIERLCKLYISCGYGSGKSYSNTFKLGATHTILDRLEKMQKEVRSTTSDNVLVKFDKEKSDLEKFLKNFNFKKVTVANKATSRDGLNDGIAAGNSINLNTGKELGPTHRSLKS